MLCTAVYFSKMTGKMPHNNNTYKISCIHIIIAKHMSFNDSA